MIVFHAILAHTACMRNKEEGVGRTDHLLFFEMMRTT
jgi:hypothetical protein